MERFNRLAPRKGNKKALIAVGHSYERVSPGPYLELFARRPQPNWDAWGNEIASDIVIPGYPVPKYSDKVKESEEV